jgi:hypothetical protein
MRLRAYFLLSLSIGLVDAIRLPFSTPMEVTPPAVGIGFRDGGLLGRHHYGQ